MAVGEDSELCTCKLVLSGCRSGVRNISQVLPFVIPLMVSGADFREEEQPWRLQKFEDAPRVPVQDFVRGFAR